MIEIELAKHIADKTNWRTLLKGDGDPIELQDRFAELLPLVEDKIAEIKQQYGDDAIEVLSENITSLSYPVQQHPTKITSHNFDKNPVVTVHCKVLKANT